MFVEARLCMDYRGLAVVHSIALHERTYPLLLDTIITVH